MYNIDSLYNYTVTLLECINGHVENNTEDKIDGWASGQYLRERWKGAKDRKREGKEGWDIS